MASNNKAKTVAKEVADRTVQAGGDRLPARDRAQARTGGRFRRRAARPRWAARCGLPEPPRKLGKTGSWRSFAAMPIRSRCASPVTIRRCIAGCNRPASRRARCSRRSSRRASKRSARAAWTASHDNLAAMLDERFHRGKFDQITERADAPIEDAMAMMVRERLTGMAPPPAAKKLVDLWRPLIEERAGRDLDRLEGLVEDQRQFSDAVHDLLDALEMGEDRSHDSEEEEEGEEDRRKQESGEDGDAADSDEMQRMSMEDTQVSAEDMPDAAAEAVEAPTADSADDTDMGDAETPGEPQRPRHFGANEPRGPGLSRFHRQVRRDSRRRGSVRAGRARPSARLSRQAALSSAGRRRASCQPAAAPPDGAAEPLLGIRSRGRPARSGAPVAHHRRSAASAFVQG